MEIFYLNCFLSLWTRLYVSICKFAYIDFRNSSMHGPRFTTVCNRRSCSFSVSREKTFFGYWLDRNQIYVLLKLMIKHVFINFVWNRGNGKKNLGIWKLRLRQEMVKICVYFWSKIGKICNFLKIVSFSENTFVCVNEQ